MAFFDLPKDEELTPEVRECFEEVRQLRRSGDVPPNWMAYARLPRIIRGRAAAHANLFKASKFPWEAQMVAFMLIAHARRCQHCFTVARAQLDRLGFDEAALDGFCANPAALPLKERDQLFVQYALKIAISPADIRSKDFAELEARGFSREDVQDMIAFAAYAVMQTIFATVTNTALRDE